MPSIQETYDSLVAEKAALLEKSKPLHEKREEIVPRLRAVEKEYAEINAAIKEVEKPVYELSVQIAALARLLPNHVKMPVEQ